LPLWELGRLKALARVESSPQLAAPNLQGKLEVIHRVMHR
jgi:hypothetical protein